MTRYVFRTPDLGEGTVEAEVGKWHVGPGDVVSENDVVVELMTDKAAVEVPSPVNGRVVSISGQAGDRLAVGSELLVFELADGAEPAARARVEPTRPEAERGTATSKPEASASTRVLASPAIRRRAKERGIDLGGIRGSGPRGRILARDLQIDDELARAPASRLPDAAELDVVRVIGLRRVIARRMTETHRSVPHFSYVEEIDITELASLRNHLNVDRPKAEQLTFLPFLVLALVDALKRFPQCNSLYDAERDVLLRYRAVHVGIATQTSDGLKVPVIRNAQALSLDDLHIAIRRAADGARAGISKREDLSGSTVTVTSLGKLGGIATTPILNSPEVSIVGINRAIERVVVRSGAMTPRLMMNVSSSFDHRFVDGYDAAAMIQRMKELLENPATLFMMRTGTRADGFQ